MKVEVTWDDIAEGVCFDGARCPIARAMYRALRRPVSVDVWHWGYAENTRAYLMPKIATQFVKDFDDRRGVKPISFELPDVE